MSTALLTADEAARLRPGKQLVIVRAGDRDPHIDWEAESYEVEFVAPKAWVALTGPCPTCWGDSWANLDKVTCPSSDCHRGRRIEPLYTECQTCFGNPMKYLDLGYCPKCGPPRGLRLAGRGSIEVVPVLDGGDKWDGIGTVYDVSHRWLYRQDDGGIPYEFDPLPVPGRGWGIVIDCVEVANG